MELIDAIFYINLASRPDRHTHFLQEISYLCTDADKLHRIDAIYDTDGAIGCTKSHCLAIETFLENPEWKTCIVFEDDFTFYNTDISYNNKILRDSMTHVPQWDCFMLAISKWNKEVQHTDVPFVQKVIKGQTASGYALTRSFAPILLQTLREGLRNLIATHDSSKYTNDQSWKGLQPLYNWYVSVPCLGYQYANFSNIEQKVVKYDC